MPQNVHSPCVWSKDVNATPTKTPAASCRNLLDDCTIHVESRGPRAAKQPRKRGINLSYYPKNQQSSPNGLVLGQRQLNTPQGDMRGPGGIPHGGGSDGFASTPCWDVGRATCRRRRGRILGANLTLWTKINSKWTEGLGVKPELQKQEKDLGEMWTRPEFPRHSTKSTTPKKVN